MFGFALGLVFLAASTGYSALIHYTETAKTAANRSAAMADLATELLLNKLLMDGRGSLNADALQRLSLSDGQSLAVINESLRLVARMPVADAGTSSMASLSSELFTRQFFESKRERDQAVLKSPIDKKERFYAFQRVPGSPYIVVVGEETAVALKVWLHSLVVSAAGVLVIAILGLFLLRQFASRARAEKELLIENRERKRSQLSAETSKARLQALIDSIPDMVFLLSSDGYIEFVHAVDEAQLLRPAEELIGLHYREVLPPGLTSRFDEVISSVEYLQDNQRIEYQLYIDGIACDFEARVSPLGTTEEERQGFIAVVRDITESKQRSAELRIASTAFDTHLGIMITDKTGLILRVNKAFTRITGYDEGEVIGKNPRILQSGLQDGAFYNHLWARVRETGSWEGEIWNRQKTGEVFAEWLTVTAIRGEDGQIQNYVGTFHDITKRKEAEKEVYRLAFYDSLTGLANRALLQDRITEVCKSNSREGTLAALLYLDIDQFRSINDARGYGVGDLVLKAIASILTSTLRENDTLARVGGDEFAVLLLNLPKPQEVSARLAENVSDKILREFVRPVSVLDHRVQVEVSIGIALIDGSVATSEQQLQRAEQATQQAKERSKLRGERPTAFFDPDLQARVVEHVILEEELRFALDKDQLILCFQPQIMHPDLLIGYEVLLRWRHPRQGMISPNRFIPLAEHSRLIIPIGYWVLEQACELLALWRNDPEKSTHSLAVNVSVIQFQAEGFAAQVEHIVEKTGAPAHQLKLEVTESLLMDNPDQITDTMHRLRRLGIRFSLDDFGTGFSSMSYLKRLPLDQIKIDQSFVRGVTVDSANAAIVSSIIGLSKGLGLEVIAEGVETEHQQSWLVEHECLRFQGYLFGRPTERI
ncbi:MAG: bifunctional diguanylate cyclase/phosphodiesterase [Pseudomonadota bacterium]